MNATIQEKKKSILDTALALVRNIGFESVSIAHLAKEVGMSKSGLFAHFNSKEKMHLMILDHAAFKFSHDVFRKSIKTERGIPRLKAIVKNWISWYRRGQGGTCPFLAAAVEYDSRPGKVKDRLQLHTSTLIKSLEKSIAICVEEEQFDSKIDKKAVAFELYSLIMGHLIYLRTIENKQATKLFQSSFDSLIQRYSV